ncbi:MAG: CDP-diacylglycerol--glycerol-3-phosphate 3-phosphatidyltransferase [Planctomycetes bacterium]|nr:CDP-diacylglycerol--glycerol-3-phosphate 3-phosphatidyltransferase [Planctomycetota bacterium]
MQREVEQNAAALEAKPPTSSPLELVDELVHVSKLTWANRITLFRIFLIPVFVLCVMQAHDVPPCRYLAIGVFIVMALSDALDGYLARRWAQRTRLGFFLDPLADKLLVMTACVLLSCDFWPGPRFPNWIPVIVISRDAFILLGGLMLLLLTGTVKGGPSLLGKATTFVQMLSVVGILLNNHLSLSTVRASWWVVAAFTLVSGVDYMRAGVRQLKRV